VLIDCLNGMATFSLQLCYFKRQKPGMHNVERYHCL